MGHHKFNIGSFFKDVGHKIESVANVPKIVSTIEHTADRGLKTVERVGGSIVNEGKHLVDEAVVGGVKGLANSMMMPLMIGGAVVLLILLKK
jgi:hypothetical protein